MSTSAENLDELLEQLWMTREEGEMSRAQFADRVGDEIAAGALRQMISVGLARLVGEEILFTEDGEKAARDIVRRHRLAERLLSDVLELPDPQAEDSACRFEHILSPEVTESLCSFLGHPRLCPHGKPIPRGNCCATFTTEIKPMVIRLQELNPGDHSAIVFISAKHRSRLERLSAFGIVPGGRLILHQKRPSFIIQVGETEVALDREIVSEIYVKRIDPPTEDRWKREAF